MNFDEALIEHLTLFSSLHTISESVNQATHVISQTLAKGGKLMLCGNGGSAADCQHIAAEFMGRFTKNRAPISAISLATDNSTITCISNDFSYDEIFSRQVQALGKQGDCLIGISTSGNSKNIIKAMEFANVNGISTIGILGNNGGIVSGLCNVKIIVPSHNTARIQEAHILIGHSICGTVEMQLGLI